MISFAKKLVFLVLLASAFVITTAAPSYASHFRYGTITWRTPNPGIPRQVEFTAQLAFRRSFFGTPNVGDTVVPGSLCYGDGVCDNLSLVVQSVDVANDWIQGTFVMNHLYAAAGTYIVDHSNCCRFSSLLNNHDTNWRVSTQVTIPVSGTPNQPPRSALLPIISVQAGVINTFVVPATDPEGDPLTFSLATPTDMGDPSEVQPPGIAIDPVTGRVTFHASTTIGLYTTQIKISDGHSYIVVDFIINNINSVIGQPPSCLINSSSLAQTFNVAAGVHVGFTLLSTDPDGGTVTLQWSGQSGASMTPGLAFTTAPNLIPPQNSSIFSWTPVKLDGGSHVISFSCTDSVGQQTQNSVTINVSVPASTTSISSNVNPATIGQTVIFSATVAAASGSGTPTGTVQFMDGAANLGSPVAVGGSLSTASLSVGSHSITAVYSGDSVFTGSVSQVLVEVVNHTSTTTTVSVDPTSTVSYGGTTKFNVTVTPTSGSPLPTGTVQYVLDGVNFGSPVNKNPGQFVVQALAAGTHTLSAVYNGDTNFASSTAPAIQFTINKAAPNTLPFTTSQNPAPLGSPVTFTARLGGVNQPSQFGNVVFATLPPTGQATLLDTNSSAIAVASLVADPSQSPTPTATPTFAGITTLTAGQHTLHISYTGDSNYISLVSSGSSLTETIQASTATSVTSSLNPSTQYTDVTFTAQVSSAGGIPAAGTVSFNEGSVSNVIGVGPINASGVATITTHALSIGSHDIFAVYSGSGGVTPTFLGSTAAHIQQFVMPMVPSFTQIIAQQDGACICSPLLMNTDPSGSQDWFVKADAVGTVTITAFAHAVNGVDAENLNVDVYNTSGVLQTTITTGYPAGSPSGTETSAIGSVLGAPGAVYWLHVTTPATPPTQPHYRFKFEGAVTAATNPPSSPSFEESRTTWQFNVGPTDTVLNVRIFSTGVPAPGAGDTPTMTYTWISPSGVVSAPATIAAPPAGIDTILTAPGIDVGPWQLTLEGNEHYRIDVDPAVSDSAIYMSWMTAGQGTIHGAVTLNGAPFLYPAQVFVTAADGTPLGMATTSTGSYSIDKIAVGPVSIRIQLAPGWVVTPSQLVANVICDRDFVADFAVADNTPPVLTLPADQTIEATGPGGAVANFIATAFDAVDGLVPVICVPSSGSLFAIAPATPGVTPVSCSAADAQHNTAHGGFAITVVDTTAPVVTVPSSPITAEATTAAGATVTFSATATDIVDGAIASVCTPTSGSTFAIGATTVTCNATDAHNNTGTNSFTVSVRDTTPPVLTAPVSQTIEATSVNGAIASFVATASDLVDGPLTPTCTPASGSVFGINATTSRTTPATCSATDSHGNTVTGTFTVTVRDTTPPLVTVPAPISVEATTSNGAVVTFSASATDIVDGLLAPACVPASGSVFPIGLTSVTCMSMDAHGNTGTSSFAVTVKDSTPPQLFVSPDLTREATAPSGASVTYAAATATDIVDGVLPTTCAPVSGSMFAIDAATAHTTTVACSASDSHGNTANRSFMVTVVDTTAPTVIVPTAPVTASATGASGAVVTFSASATDLVDITDAVSCSPASGSTFAIGTSNVICTSTDAHGNTGTNAFAVTVRDTTPPVVTGTSVSTEATALQTPVTFTATAADAVDGPVTPVLCTPASGSSFAVGVTTVTCKATDAHGNLGSGTLTVTVTDRTGPIFTVADITKNAATPAGASVTFAFTAADLVDGTVPVTCVPASATTFAIGTTPVTCTATDAHGNATIHGFNVKVVDLAPVAVNDVSTGQWNTAVVVGGTGVLGNDTDGNGDSLLAVLVTGPAHGALTLNPNGSYSYVPAANFSGTDAFTYKATDGTLTSNVATVTIKITTPCPGDGDRDDLTHPDRDDCKAGTPIAKNDAYTTNHDATITVPAKGILLNDSYAVSASLIANVAHGTLVLNANGGFVYTPAAGFAGNDTFTYVARNAAAVASPLATVTITVKANLPPDADDDYYTTKKNVTLTIAGTGVLANDSDPNGDAIVAVLATAPSHGTLTLNANGSFTYKPAANYTGTDSFSYRAKDTGGMTDTAAVTIKVTGHFDGDGCDHDKHRSGHHDGDGDDHDRDTHDDQHNDSKHHAGDYCDHDLHRNGHYDGDGCEHDRGR